MHTGLFLFISHLYRSAVTNVVTLRRISTPTHISRCHFRSTPMFSSISLVEIDEITLEMPVFSRSTRRSKASSLWCASASATDCSGTARACCTHSQRRGQQLHRRWHSHFGVGRHRTTDSTLLLCCSSHMFCFRRVNSTTRCSSVKLASVARCCMRMRCQQTATATHCPI